MLHNNKMRITFIVMAAPLWTLICQSKSDYIQAIAQEIIKIWIFYIYMNIYLHVKVFIFVPRVDFNIIISHLSDNISYYKMFIHKHSCKYYNEYPSPIRVMANKYSVPEFWTRHTPTMASVVLPWTDSEVTSVTENNLWHLKTQIPTYLELNVGYHKALSLDLFYL